MRRGQSVSMKICVPERVTYPFGSLDIELDVVLEGVSNGAVKLYALDSDTGESVGYVGFR
jgi:hypothetical protein